MRAIVLLFCLSFFCDTQACFKKCTEHSSDEETPSPRLPLLKKNPSKPKTNPFNEKKTPIESVTQKVSSSTKKNTHIKTILTTCEPICRINMHLEPDYLSALTIKSLFIFKLNSGKIVEYYPNFKASARCEGDEHISLFDCINQTNITMKNNTNYHCNYTTNTVIINNEFHADHASTGVSRFGNYLVTLGVDGTIKMWDPLEKKNVASFKGHSHKVRNVIELDQNSFISAAEDGAVVLWRIEQQPQDNLQLKEKSIIFSDNTGIGCMILLNNTTLACGSLSGTIHVINLENNSVIASHKIHTKRVTGLIFLPDNKLLSCSLDCNINLLDLGHSQN